MYSLYNFINLRPFLINIAIVIILQFCPYFFNIFISNLISFYSSFVLLHYAFFFPFLSFSLNYIFSFSSPCFYSMILFMPPLSCQNHFNFFLSSHMLFFCLIILSFHLCSLLICCWYCCGCSFSSILFLFFHPFYYFQTFSCSILPSSFPFLFMF